MVDSSGSAGWIFGLVVAALALRPSSVGAEPISEPYSEPPKRVRVGPTIREHDGFYLRVGLGAGAIQATIGGGTAPEMTAGGLAYASEIAVGGTPAEGLVVGGGFYTQIVDHTLRNGAVSYSGGGSILYAPFVDYYFDPKDGYHVQGAAGLILIPVSGGNVGPESIAHHTSAGAGVMAGAGKEWWTGEQWSMGGLLRFTYGYGWASRQGDFRDRVFGAVVLGNLTWH